MKRPILVAVIGYIIGILTGLYLKISIALLYLLIILITVLLKLLKQKIIKINRKKKFSFYSLSRYLRYIKLLLNRKVIITIIIFSCLSNLIIKEKNKVYDSFYRTTEDVQIIAKVISNAQEKDYKNVYKIQVIEINKFKKDVFLYLNVEKKQKIKFGDIINIKGIYKAPSIQRNYGGFDYREYLKSLNIYGSVTAKTIETIKEAQENETEVIINNVREKLKENVKKYLDEETYSIYLGLILGDTTYIEDTTKEAFRNSNMGHILAVSGMHITYIIIGIVIFFNKISGKKIANIISVIILIFYIIITGYSPSIIRACSMVIIMLIGKIINRKSDIWTSLAISLFIILIYNPFLITNIGLQYTYLGTLGIVLLNKNIVKLLKTKNHPKESKIKKLIAVSISVQLFILPITLFHFNTFGIYFLITNLLLSFIIGPVIILGFIFLLFSIINLPLISILSIPLNIGIKIIVFISNISNLPFSKIYFRTPKIIEIILYYLFILFISFIYSKLTDRKQTSFNLRIKYMIHLFKYNFRKYKNKVIALMSLIIIVFLSLFFIIPKSLKIHFVDVGQGDCCFIETPSNKTILIDGGGNENYDIGKNTLLPYILDRGYTKLDYIIISHFDTDHIGGLLTVIEELKVGKIIISKQGEDSNNFQNFKKIVNDKKIKVAIVSKGDKLKIENDLYFDVLWPKEGGLISQNTLNNNSIVFKLRYKNFSMLFTGDIEEIAENQILKEYKNDLQSLNSTVLKVGHHGSKTSSTKEFIDEVKPLIALIGVGENNKFGHPNGDVLQRFEILRCENLQN